MHIASGLFYLSIFTLIHPTHSDFSDLVPEATSSRLPEDSGFYASLWYFDSESSLFLCESVPQHDQNSVEFSLISTEPHEIALKLTSATHESLSLSVVRTLGDAWRLLEIRMTADRVAMCVDGGCKVATSLGFPAIHFYGKLSCDRGVDQGSTREATASVVTCPEAYQRARIILAEQPCAYRSTPVTSSLELQVDFMNSLAFDYTLPTGENICFGTETRRSYPDFAPFDPVPSKDRGVYLGLTSHGSMLWLSGVGNPVQYGKGLTVEMWVILRDWGHLFHMYSVDNGDSKSLLELYIIGSDKQRLIYVNLNDSDDKLHTVKTSAEVTIGSKWANVGISVGYDSDKTRIMVFWNGYTESFLLGKAFVPTTVPWIKLGSTMLGHLYRVHIAKREKPIAEILQHSGSCQGCMCPIGVSQCLPTCDLNEYVDGLGQCKPCLESCKYGCVRPTDCNLCADPLCYRCSNFDIGSCSACIPGASFVSGVCKCDAGTFPANGKCVTACPGGYFLSNSECVLCSRGCLNCDSAGCLKCQSSYFLIDGVCTCEHGYFIDIDLSCKKCQALCIECKHTAIQCTDCLTGSGYVLATETCKDCGTITGYMGGLGVEKQPPNLSEKDAINAVCKEICGDGLTMGQLACDDGNLIDGDGCSSKCEIEPGWECSIPIPGGKSVCVDRTPPTAMLTYVNTTSDGYQLTFTFSEEVTMATSLESNSELIIDNVNLFSFAFSKVSSTSYTLRIQPFQSIKRMTKVTVSIIDATTIMDIRGNTLNSSQFSTTIPDSFSIESAQSLSKAMNGVSASMSLVASSSIMTSVFGGTSLNLLWSLLEVLQIINYLVFLSAVLPENLRAFLRSLNFANFQFVPSFFSDSDGFPSPPAPFVYEEVSTGFLTNCGNMVTIWIALLLLCVLCVGVASLLPAVSMLRKIKAKFIYSVFLRTWIESFLQLCLAVALQLQNPIASSNSDVCSLVLGIAVLFGLGYIVGLTVVKVTLKPREVLKEESHKQRFDSLYGDFAKSRILSKSFILLQLCRKALFVLSLTLLSDFSSVQSILITVLNAAYTLVLALTRPFKRHLSANRKEVISECLFTLALCLISVLSLDLSISTRDRLGWVVIALLLSMIFMHFYHLITSQLRALKRLFASWNAHYSSRQAHYSSNHTDSLLESHRAWPDYDKSKIAPMKDAKDFELEVVTTQPMEQTFSAEEYLSQPIDQSAPSLQK